MRLEAEAASGTLALLGSTSRLGIFVANRHKISRSQGWHRVVYLSPDLGLINLNGSVVAPRPNRPWRVMPIAAGEGRR